MNISQKLYNPFYQAIILSVFFVVAYFIPLKSIFHTWMTNDDYSYGFLIPVIAAYMFWERRQVLKHVTYYTCWRVFPVLLFFVLLSLYGILGSSGNVSRPAIPILIILFASFCFGLDFLKKAFLPLVFFIFMIPLPPSIDRTLGVYLKSISSELGGMLLRLLGYSAYVSGNVIDLGITKLQVVDACSGLRYLFPLMALGIVYGHFFEKSLWKKIVCFLATIPIAILTNVFRIGMTGILTYHYGPEMAEGFFHDFQGVVTFLFAFFLLFVLGKILRFFPDGNKKFIDFEFQLCPKKNQQNGTVQGVIVSLLLLLVVAGFTLSTSALPSVELKGGMASFPLSFGDWKGMSIPIEQEIVDASGAEDAFNGVFFKKNGESVFLYIGYRGSAFLQNDNYFHSPTVCLPASGWKVLSVSKRTIPNVPRFGELSVSEMIIEKMGIKRLVYFWFQTKDQASWNKNINRFHLALHAIKKEDTYTLFVRPITPIGDNESVDDARVRLDRFVREFIRVWDRFLKEKTQS